MMNCNKCGHRDALALFTSILCVNNFCEFYNTDYAEEKGYLPRDSQKKNSETHELIKTPNEAEKNEANPKELVLEISGQMPNFNLGNKKNDKFEPKSCKVTGNLCGTDTWPVGYGCDCEACQSWFDLFSDFTHLGDYGTFSLTDYGYVDYDNWLWGNTHTTTSQVIYLNSDIPVVTYPYNSSLSTNSCWTSLRIM